MRHWGEVKCDYIDEDDLFWRVDAWKSADDDEEGKVIAYIDDLTGRVIYTDPIARVDEYVQEIIKEKKKEISCREKGVAFGWKMQPMLQVKTPYGILRADYDEEELQRIYISIQPPGIDKYDIACVDANKDGLRIRTWDIDSEVESFVREISKEEIQETINEITDWEVESTYSRMVTPKIQTLSPDPETKQ